MNTITLINPTDDQLSATVAEYLTGAAFWAETRGQYTLAVMHDAARPPWQHWDTKEVERNKPRYKRITGVEAVRMGFFGSGAPDFATSADAVLPLLEAHEDVQISHRGKQWCVVINDWHGGESKSLSRAACIALLQAAGHTVEVKP